MFDEFRVHFDDNNILFARKCLVKKSINLVPVLLVLKKAFDTTYKFIIRPQSIYKQLKAKLTYCLRTLFYCAFFIL